MAWQFSLTQIGRTQKIGARAKKPIYMQEKNTLFAEWNEAEWVLWVVKAYYTSNC